MTTYATAPVAPLPLATGKGTLFAYTASGGTAPDFYAAITGSGNSPATLVVNPYDTNVDPAKWPAGYARLCAELGIAQ